MFNMSIQNLIINGSFETGTLTSWISANTTVTSQFSHSGSFSARFQSSPFTSYIGQFVPLNPGESMEVLASFAKVGTAPSTPIFIQVTFYDSLSNLLGSGLGTTIPIDHIPTVDNDTWLEIYQTTTPAPPNTAQAFILIYTSPQAGTANGLVDDVALLVAPDTGATGAAGGNLAFGSLYSSISNKPAVLGGSIDFDFAGPSLNFIPNPVNNTITIIDAGVYEITADLPMSSPGSLTLEVFIGATPIIPQSTFFAQDTATPGKNFQINLSAGDVISLRVVGSSVGSQYTATALTVKRIQ